MDRPVVIYSVPELPDPAFARHRAIADGDVRSVIGEGFEHFLRTLASLEPGSTTAEIRFHYEPSQGGHHQQERCQILISIASEDERLSDQVSALLSRGPLCCFYRFVSTPPEHFVDGGYTVAYAIARRANLLKPLYEPEFNAKIPRSYLTVDPFVSEENNDWKLLDRVFGNLDEPADVSVRVEPIDVSHELLHHTAYLSRLLSVNRSFDDEDGRWSDVDFLGLGNDPGRRSALSLRPLRLRDPLADDLLRRQQRFHETLLERHLAFDILVKARSETVARLVASTVAESAFRDGSYQLYTIDQSNGVSDAVLSNRMGARVVGAESLVTRHEDADGLYGKLRRLPSVATAKELLGAFRLPIGTRSSPSTMRKNTDPEDANGDSLIVLGHDQDPPQSETGSTRSERARGPRLSNLCKHTSIFGMSGTGKTTAETGMVLQLNEEAIPFLVLETVKKEYRLIKALRSCNDPAARKLAEALQVFTPGSDTSPFRFNPLAKPPEVDRDEHIGDLMSCFRAAFPMPGPLQALISESLERLYDDYPDPTHPPVVADLVQTAETVLQEKRYSGDTNSDLRAALDVRLGSLARGAIGRVFQCRESAPSMKRLTEVPSIIELDRLPPELACLVTLFVLTAVYKTLKASPAKNGSPRFMIIIEEAHNVVGRNTSAVTSEDVVDPRAHAAAYVCRMLAELGALGVGIIIIDQLPSAVAAEVTKSTATKLAFREVANDDRAELGGTMLFGDMEFDEIARLNTGEAFFFTEGYHGPRRIRAVNLHEKLKLPRPPSDAELKELLQTEAWFVETRERRVGCELSQLRERIEAFDDQRLRLTRRLVGLSKRCAAILARSRCAMRQTELNRVANAARRLKAELMTAQRGFLRGPYSALLPNAADCSGDMELIRTELKRRVHEITEPGVRSCLQRLDRLVERCCDSAT